MSQSKKHKSKGRTQARPQVPSHPLFELSGREASFIECVDAIDRVSSVIELYNFLGQGADSGQELSPRAESAYWKLLRMLCESLGYISDRLMVLHREQGHTKRRDAEYLQALLSALPTLGTVNRDRYLNRVAAQLDISRSVVDQYIRQANLAKKSLH